MLGCVAVTVDRLQASAVVENSPDHLFILLSSIQRACVLRFSTLVNFNQQVHFTPLASHLSEWHRVLVFLL